VALAREHLEQSLAFYSRDQGYSSSITWQDIRVTDLSLLAISLWCLGYPDQAAKRIQEALVLARGLSQPLSLTFALIYAVRLHQLLGEKVAAQGHLAEFMSLCEEQGFAFWSATGTIARGSVLVEQGEEQQGIVLMRRGLAARHAQGGKIGDPYYLSLLAEAYGMAGQIEEGIALAAEQLARIKETGERVWEAELYRVMGSLLLGRATGKEGSPKEEIEACFLQALSVAGNRGAKSLELRAAMCLARLWQNVGKKAEARQVLAKVYGWFTEGFDTKDLTEAKALLQDLNS
jgi:predicted ATPase